MSQKVTSLLLKALGFLSFAVVAFVALFWANGYSFDFANRDIRKTSIVDIDVNQDQDADVYLNDTLKSSKVPYQIKEIFPGKYNLKIVKPGFWEWTKIVEVDEDIVTRINHVLLIPRMMRDYAQVIKLFGQDDKFFEFVNTSYLAIYSSKSKLLRFNKFNDNGLIEFKEYDLSKILLADENLTNIKLIDNDLIFISDKGYRYISNLNEDIFTKLNLPSQFAFAGNSFYYGNDSLFFKADEDGKVINVYFDAPAQIQQIQFVRQNIFKFTFKNSKKQSLYLLQNNQLKLISADLSDDPIFIANKVLFMEYGTDLRSFDLSTNQKKLLGRFGFDFKLIAFVDINHFIYQSDEHIYLADNFFDNVYPIFLKNEIDDLWVVDGIIYTMKKGVVSGYKW